MNFLGGHLPAFQFAAEKLIGVAEALKKGGEEGGQRAGVGKKKVVKLLHIHEMEAGGFQGAGGGGAGLVVQKGHFAKDIAGNKMAEGDIALPAHVDGDFDPA